MPCDVCDNILKSIIVIIQGLRSRGARRAFAPLDFTNHLFILCKECNNKGSEQAQLTNVKNQICLDPTTYRSQNHVKNFLKLKILGLD